MLPRFPHRSELENAVRGTKLNSSTARQKNMMLSAGVLKVRVFRHREYIVKTAMLLIWACFRVHKKCCVLRCTSMML